MNVEFGRRCPGSLAIAGVMLKKLGLRKLGSKGNTGPSEPHGGSAAATREGTNLGLSASQSPPWLTGPVTPAPLGYGHSSLSTSPSGSPSHHLSTSGGLHAHHGSSTASAALAALEMTPRADVSLPHGVPRQRRRSSNTTSSGAAGALLAAAAAEAAVHAADELVELPQLYDTPMDKREALFRAKLALCCTEFSWADVPTGFSDDVDSLPPLPPTFSPAAAALIERERWGREVKVR